jgi:hypothetical protein
MRPITSTLARCRLGATPILLVLPLAGACITVQAASTGGGGGDPPADAAAGDAPTSNVGAQLDAADSASTLGSALRNQATVFKDNGHAYLLVCEGQIRFDVARQAAKDVGGYLATLTTRDENTFVGALVVQSKSQRPGCWNSHSGPWLGAERRSGSGLWTWVTDEPWVPADAIWHPGQPDNGSGIVEEDALQAFTFNGTMAWNDASRAFTVAGYVIEWEK